MANKFILIQATGSFFYDQMEKDSSLIRVFLRKKNIRQSSANFVRNKIGVIIGISKIFKHSPTEPLLIHLSVQADRHPLFSVMDFRHQVIGGCGDNAVGLVLITGLGMRPDAVNACQGKDLVIA